MRLIRNLNREGRTHIKLLFWVLLIVCVLYGGAKLVPVYFGYFMLKVEVTDEAKVAHMYSNATVKRHILDKARAWTLPLGKKNIKIKRGRRDISIKVDYDVKLVFFGRYKKVLPFHIEAEKPLKEYSGILK